MFESQINMTKNTIFVVPASGTSYDWYSAVLKSRFTYTIELRKGKPENMRWILPKEEIIPSGEEVWEGLRVMFKKMVELSNV